MTDQEKKRIWTPVTDDRQKDYDKEMKSSGFIKIRMRLAKGHYAIRYVPKSYLRGVDEEVIE